MERSKYFEFTAEEQSAVSACIRQAQEFLSPHACKDADAIFAKDKPLPPYRTAFTSDVDNILNHPLYNRYCDKTQVFSFYRNDDITRRALHVQLVSRIARTIGRALGLNLDLIEAIALGHDIGHTPFGHWGEQFLSELYYERKKRYFHHNVQSARALYTLNGKRISLQTLDGVLAHCGEKVREVYEPSALGTFSDFENKLDRCRTEEGFVKKLRPGTLEGCVMRISDIVAYVGKDRQDLYKAGQGNIYNRLPENLLGKSNTELVSKLTSNIIKKSLGKNYIGMDPEVYRALDEAKQANSDSIYQADQQIQQYKDKIKPMMGKLYEKLLEEMKNESSVIQCYFVQDKLQGTYYRENAGQFTDDDIVADFIASMTDDYFVDLYEHYFGPAELQYIPYDFGKG